MDNCRNILGGLLFGKLFENILGLNAHEVQNLKSELSENHAECEEYANDCNANLGEPRCADLIGNVEYVDECDDCDEQQNCKNDANNYPCGYTCGSSVLDDSNHNVFGCLRPANNSCALGELCLLGCFLTIVYNIVYNPSGSILCLNDVILSGYFKCFLLILVFITGVGIGQFERTVILTTNLEESQACGSTLDLSEIGCGNALEHFVRCQCNNNMVNGNRNVLNSNVNIAGEFNGGLVADDTLRFTGCHVGDDDLGLVSDLSKSGNLNVISINDFTAYIVAGVNVVNAGSGCAFELNHVAVCKSSLNESLIICTLDVFVKRCVCCFPNITEFNTIDLTLERLECIYIQLAELVRYTQNDLVINIELECDRGQFVVYAEESDDGLSTELGGKVFAAQPRPAFTNCIITGKIKCENIRNNIVCCIVKQCVGVSSNTVAVYIVVNIIGSNLCIVLNGGRAGNRIALGNQVDFIGSIDNRLRVCNSLQAFYLCNHKLCACFVPTTGNTFYDNSGKFIRFDIKIAFQLVSCLNRDIIFVNNGKVGEMLSREGNTACAIGINSNSVFFAIGINDSLLVIALFNAVKGKCDYNGCAFVKRVAVVKSVTIGNVIKPEVVSLSSAAGSKSKSKICIGLIVKANNCVGTCIINELAQHCNIQGNGGLLCYACFGCKYEYDSVVFKLTQQCNRHCKANLCLPSVLEDNLVFGGSAFNYIIVAIYQIVDFHIGNSLFGSGYFGSSYFGSGLFGSGLFGSGLFRGGLFGSWLPGSGLLGSGYFGSGFGNIIVSHSNLNGDILGRHSGDDCLGSNIAPAFKIGIAVVVVNHFGQLNTSGQEGCEDNLVVFVNKGCTVDVGYVEGNFCTGGDNRIAGEYHIHKVVDLFCDLILTIRYGRYTSCYNINDFLQAVADDCLNVEGNILLEYERSVACIEILQAVVCKQFTNLGLEQIVRNTNSIALYIVVNKGCVFCLINDCGIEVCEGIGGSCCVFEQFLHIKVVTCFFCKLFDNIINGVIKVTVHLCGQTVGDLYTGNTFKLFYKYFKGGNGCKCIDKVLCFEVVG